MLKFLTGVAILILAIFLQLQFAAVGVYFNILLAALIAFASTFDFLELLCLDLIAIFLLNWEPWPSVTLVIFALIPLAVYAARKIFHTEPWLSNLAALAVGLLIFYVISEPSFIFSHLILFFEDLLIVLITGQLVFFALA